MPYIKLEQFSGIAPRIGPTNLSPNQAQKAHNVKLQSGELRPWRKPTLAYQPTGPDTNTIYRLVNQNTGASAWLEWAGDVNVVPGPVADTSEFRVYYTGDGAPKKTNWALATTSGAGVKPFPNAYQMLGVPAPAAAPTLASAGGSAPAETRAYVYTYVNTFGAVLEESAPSAAATVSTFTSGATVTISGFSTAPTTAAGYNVTAIRIYRSVTSGTTAAYLYVGQVTVTPSTGVASGSFSDTLTAAQLGVSLPSLYFTPPPSGLTGLVAMPNGILAGFVGNQVWFCEPYLPHAWPSAYMMTVGSPIIGLGVFGQTLVVCTTSNPYLITGSTPGGMSQEKLALPEPCISKRSIVGDQYGVLYASPNGVVSISPSTQDVISRPLLTKDEWATYAPSTMLSVIYQNMYIVFYNAGSVRQSMVFTRGDNPPLITMDTAAKAAYFENTTANVYVVDPTDNSIYQLDSDSVNNMFYEWTSKKFILPEPTNFAAMQVQADWAYIGSTAGYNTDVAAIIAANQAIWASGAALNSTVNAQQVNGYALNGSTLTPLPTVADTRNVQAIVISDDTQVASNGFTSQDPVRMPAVNRGYVYEVKLTGNAPLRQFVMATSVKELRQV
jgi:hypothetical protein